MKILKLMCCLTLLLLLTSCGVLTQRPPDQAVKLAITQQLTNVQQSIAKDLRISNKGNATRPNFEIEKVTVRSRQKLKASDALMRQYSDQNMTELYRVQGTFNAMIIGSSAQKIRQEGPFEVYLGTDAVPDTEEPEAVETWFLIQP
ncbi:MAG: hypothetical protein AAFQ95_22155 [Cyanobacteria bacterium J06621_3]